MYQNIVIDSVNLAYKLYSEEDKKEVLEISQKIVLPSFFNSFIKGVEELKSRYLLPSGHIYLLFDNYFSKADMKANLLYINRKQLSEAYKSNRKKQDKSFYNTLNLLRYYFQIGDSSYSVIRIDNLEADDLVKPLVTEKLKKESVLLVSNDLDWCRYLDKEVDILQNLSSVPVSRDFISEKLGFPLTENSLILYKSIFGDKSDDIAPLVSETEENKQLFLSLLKEDHFLENITYLCRIRNDSLCLALREKERQLQINVQLVSSIPCTLEVLKSHEVVGREAIVLKSALREALGLDVRVKKFEFGNRRMVKK